ncbi:MAG: hypothetical protein LAO03_16095 [Acidobacteriia bacterium]|nr:hypothetical protein [Terriglobia bacterium]
MTQLLQMRRVLVIVLALGLFAIAARGVTDPDVWWHLRTGQLILHDHAVPHTDPFSFTRFGQPWVNHEWLSDLLLYGLYRATGWAGLIVSFATLTSATFLLVFLRCPGRPYIAALATIWGAAACAPTWGVRPQMLSLFLASVFLLILEQSYDQPKRLWWMVPLTWLWLNLHAEYALGIALLGLFLLGDGLDVTFGFADWSKMGPHLRRLALVIAACLAVVPLNPNGVRMYSYPLETLRSPAMQSYIDEWSSPNFHQAKHLPMLLMLLAIMVAIPWSGRRLRPRELLLLLVMTGAALHSIRHVAIFALVAVPILSGVAVEWLERYGMAQRFAATKQTAPRNLALNAAVLIAFIAFTAVRVRTVLAGQSQLEAQRFPAAAVSFLSAQRPPGPLLNHYDWGGYLIWKVYPEYQVYVDGRADVYGDSFLQARAASYYLTDAWRETIEHWEIQTVLLPPQAPLAIALQSSPAWKQIHVDAQAVILTRTR